MIMLSLIYYITAFDNPLTLLNNTNITELKPMFTNTDLLLKKNHRMFL